VSKVRVLLVEDNEEILKLNKEMLREMSFIVASALTISQARDVLASKMPDVIVLDIMLPDGSGLTLLQELRKEGNDVPVLLLTALGNTDNILKGFQVGADDYLPKPYEMEILAARVTALARRSKRFNLGFRMGNLELDAVSHCATLGGTQMSLTQKEFSLLLLLAQNEGEYIPAVSICESVWGHGDESDLRVLWKHISNLKAKLAAVGEGAVISGARGEGYRLTRS
jgi:DNA-binding response OmpR family regulator